MLKAEMNLKKIDLQIYNHC